MTREEKFEAMLTYVQEQHQVCVDKMAALKAQGKEKTVSYREAMGNKLIYQQMLTTYKLFGLIE